MATDERDESWSFDDSTERLAFLVQRARELKDDPEFQQWVSESEKEAMADSSVEAEASTPDDIMRMIRENVGP